jgi:uroporphyrinogen III methyltransferase / synthase
MGANFMPKAPKPLQDLTILVACSAKKLAEFVSGLSAMGGTVLALPVLEAIEIEDKRLLDRSIESLNEYDWILFTSAYGVRIFMQRLKERAVDAPAGALPKLCAIGPATAAALKDFGYDASLIPERFLAEGVLEALGKYHGGIRNMAGMRILMPRALQARELLPTALAEAGAQVDVVPCYQTVQGQIDAEVLFQLHKKDPDLIVFTSSSAIRYLFEIIGREEAERMLLHSTVAVIGPITGHTAESYGKSPEIIPNESTAASLTEAIKRYYEADKKSL